MTGFHKGGPQQGGTGLVTEGHERQLIRTSWREGGRGSYPPTSSQNIMRAVHDLNARLPSSEASYGPSPTAIQNAIASAYVQVCL